MPLFSKAVLAPGGLKPADQIRRRGNGSGAVAYHHGIVVSTRKQREHDFYIIHAQASGQDQVEALGLRLEAIGASVWRDMAAEEINAAGMERAISNSRAALLFMSAGVMGSEWCNVSEVAGVAARRRRGGVDDAVHSPALRELHGLALQE